MRGSSARGLMDHEDEREISPLKGKVTLNLTPSPPSGESGERVVRRTADRVRGPLEGIRNFFTASRCRGDVFLSCWRFLTRTSREFSQDFTLGLQASSKGKSESPSALGGSQDQASSFARRSGDWTFASPKNVVAPHPSLRATVSHKERENNKGCGSNKHCIHAVATVSGNDCL